MTRFSRSAAGWTLKRPSALRSASDRPGRQAAVLRLTTAAACSTTAPRDWWDDSLSGKEPVGFTHPTIFAFLRIATNPRAFANPMTLDEAAGHIEQWLGRSVAQVLQPPSEHAADVLALLKGAGGAAGNLVTDAQVGALAHSYKAIVHTAERDFLRFKTVRCCFPLDG